MDEVGVWGGGGRAGKVWAGTGTKEARGVQDGVGIVAVEAGGWVDKVWDGTDWMRAVADETGGGVDRKGLWLAGRFFFFFFFLGTMTWAGVHVAKAVVDVTGAERVDVVAAEEEDGGRWDGGGDKGGRRWRERRIRKGRLMKDLGSNRMRVSLRAGAVGAGAGKGRKREVEAGAGVGTEEAKSGVEGMMAVAGEAGGEGDEAETGAKGTGAEADEAGGRADEMGALADEAESGMRVVDVEAEGGVDEAWDGAEGTGCEAGKVRSGVDGMGALADEAGAAVDGTMAVDDGRDGAGDAVIGAGMSGCMEEEGGVESSRAKRLGWSWMGAWACERRRYRRAAVSADRKGMGVGGGGWRMGSGRTMVLVLLESR